MPTPLKTSGNMRKHLTKNERESRESAEAEGTRVKRVNLKPPVWLSEDAKGIFNETKKKLRGLQLLDNLDTELLGIYCDAVAKYRAASKQLARVDENGQPAATDEDTKACQAWARVVSTYAEKLGLSPTARARIAKRKAEQPPMDDMERLLNEVNKELNYGRG